MIKIYNLIPIATPTTTTLLGWCCLAKCSDHILQIMRCSACAYMLNNACDMEEDDMAQNQRNVRVFGVQKES